MMEEKKRTIIELEESNIDDYCFILCDEINGNKYNVKYYPVFLYEKEKYYYGIFTSFKKDENNNLYVVNCRYLKEHLSNFTIQYKLPDSENEFLEDSKKNYLVKERIGIYKRLYNKVYKDYNTIIKLNKEVTKIDDKDELKDMLEKYDKIKNNISHYNDLKLRILLNWNLSAKKLNDLIDQAVNLITLKLNKKKDDFKAVLIIILIFIFFIGFIRSCAGGDDTSSSGNDGYSTKCYTRSDGKSCCTSCKKTSYGDIGCGTTCN